MAASVPADLPQTVQATLDAFVGAARESFGPALRSVVLFGSAAEGRLRPTSDVNVIVVLRSFEKEAVDRIREPLRVAEAAVELAPMFLLESEIDAAMQAFAVKFADIGKRRRILHGDDPFAGRVVPRHAELARLKQVLLNLALRLRAAYALRSLREEQLVRVIADAAGPLRASAAALLELEGKGARPPKEALQEVAGPAEADLLRHLSETREAQHLPPGVAGPTLLAMAELARALYDRAALLS